MKLTRKILPGRKDTAFTVGISQKAGTIAYIQSQAEHHRKRTFEDEFIAFLKKHNVEYDPRYVLG